MGRHRAHGVHGGRTGSSLSKTPLTAWDSRRAAALGLPRGRLIRASDRLPPLVLWLGESAFPKGDGAMTKVAQRAVGMVERRLSRRGFLATFGRLTLGLGMAAIGLARTARRAEAACCPSPSCDTAHAFPCPPSGAGCPPGCVPGSASTCCDAGVLHQCYRCNCAGTTCYCEEVLGSDC